MKKYDLIFTFNVEIYEDTIKELEKDTLRLIEKGNLIDIIKALEDKGIIPAVEFKLQEPQLEK